MMYYCDNCGEFFDEDEFGTSHECVGEFWGSPAYMDYDVCPYCGSYDFSECEEEDSADEEE